MLELQDVDAAIEAIRRGAEARDVESDWMEFKQEDPDLRPQRRFPGRVVLNRPDGEIDLDLLGLVEGVERSGELFARDCLSGRRAASARRLRGAVLMRPDAPLGEVLPGAFHAGGEPRSALEEPPDVR